MSERATQNEIRNALAGRGLIFRANVGQAWQGEVVSRRGRLLTLQDPRPFDTGLPVGFSDLFGLVPIVIGPEHLGQKFARFAAIEVKSPEGRIRKQQAQFLAAIEANGGIAGIARSPSDALRIVGA